MKAKWKQLNFTDILLLLSLILVGSFHEYIAYGLTVVMAARLLAVIHKNKKITLYKNSLGLAVGVICLFSLVGCLWAVDRGMALIGFLKLLPALLYLLCLWQEEKEGCATELLPYVGAAMAVISAVAMQIPALKSWFSVADRLAGFFQYPNTFALFLLVCELLLLRKEQRKLWDYGVILVLLAGILYTGSRTVFVVAALANVVMLFAVSKKRGRVVLVLLGAAACVVVAVLGFSGNPVIGRFLRFSLTESTLVGRVLYVVDALPLILKHPFGMGYMGYYYTQQSVQTGVYSVAYIHNDFLQLILDIGWIPGLVVLFWLGRFFLKKQVDLGQKIIVGAVCLHSLFDFNMQFTGMLLLLVLLTDVRGDKTIHMKKVLPCQIGAAATALVSLYLCVALAAGHWGANQLSDAMYPFNTRNKLTMLEQEADLSKADRLADEILKTNTAYYAPYTVKAAYAYSQGDFGALIRYQRQAFERNPFEYEPYETYCQMLLVGLSRYREAGDTNSAQICRQELLKVSKQLESNRYRLSKLGAMIADQPVTELPAEIREVIAQLGGS